MYIFDNLHSKNKPIVLIYWNIARVSYIVILKKDGIYIIFFIIYTVIFSSTRSSVITQTLAPELSIIALEGCG